MNKFIKKIVTAVAVISAAVTAFGTAQAAEIDTAQQNDGYSITVKNVHNGQEYKIYKLFDAKVADPSAVARDETTENPAPITGITYTVPTGKDLNDTNNEWFTTNEAGNVVLKENVSLASDSAGLRAWAESFGIPVAWTQNRLSVSSYTANETDEKNGIVFKNLTPGYYYVATTTGALVTLTSIAPNVTVKDKNSVPTMDKKITGVTDQEISTPADSATAKIGDTITYTVTIKAPKGAEGLVFHDKLSKGLTLLTEWTSPLSVTIDNKPVMEKTDTNTPKAGTIYFERTKFANNNTGNDGITDNITLTFTGDAANGAFNQETDITVTYKAVLNENAVIAGDGNPNNATLEYGHKMEKTTTPPVVRKVYTYQFDVVKTTDAKDNIPVLEGAVFSLYRISASTDKADDSVTIPKDAEKIKFVKTAGTKAGDPDVYRIATAAQSNAQATETTTITAGFVRIEGLGNGTYALKEETAPDGYNKLTQPKKVVVQDANNDAEVTASDSTETYKSGGVRVINGAGSVLPSTGGIGTRMFYLIGGILAAAAVVLLVVRRRKKA